MHVKINTQVEIYGYHLWQAIHFPWLIFNSSQLFVHELKTNHYCWQF